MATKLVNPNAILIVKPSKDRVFRNPRQTFKNISELENDIRKIGLTQKITCRENNGSIELIAGERRLRSIKNLINKDTDCWDRENQTLIKATKLFKEIEVEIVKCKNDRDAIKIAVSENLNREDVPEMDMVEFCLYLENCTEMDSSRMFSRADMEDLLGRSQPWISQTISMQELSDIVKQYLQEGKITRTAALELLQTDPSQTNKVLKYAHGIIKNEAKSKIAETNEEIEDVGAELETAQAEYDTACEVGNVEGAKEALRKIRKATKKKEEVLGRKKMLLSQDKATITTAAIQKANRELGVSNGAAKPLTMKQIRTIRKDLNSLLENNQAKKKQHIQIIAKTLDMVLGKADSDIEKILAA